MTVPSRACASCSSSSVENGTVGRQPLAQRRRQVGHLVVAGGAARRPAPHLAGAEGGLAGVGERAVEELEVHRVSYGGSDMRLAKYLAHAGVASRRAAEQLVFAGRVTVGGEVVRDPARDVDGSSAIDGRRRARRRRGGDRVVYIAQQAGRASSRPRTTPTAGARSSTWSRATAASTRSAGSTPTRPA